jgi:hypothetical protein
VTFGLEPGIDRPQSHYPLTSGWAKDVPNYFGQRDLRCPLLRPDPTQRPRLLQIHDNLTARIAEAEQQRWFGEAEGLKVSLAGAQAKLAQMDQITTRRSPVGLGTPTFPDIAARTVTTDHPAHQPATR